MLPEGLAVLVTGRLGAPTCGGLASALDEMVAAGDVRLLVDISGVDYLSSAGLVVIEQTAARVKGLGGLLVLCGLREPVRVSFEVSGAAAHLTLAETMDDGRRQLGGGPEPAAGRLS